MHPLYLRRLKIFIACVAFELLEVLVLRHMLPKLPQCRKSLKTFRLLTLERLFSRVYPHMCFKVRLFCKAFVAHLTYKRFQTDMHIFMNFQFLGSLKRLATNFAPVRFFAGVDHVVRSHITVGVESLITVFKSTFEWTISMMNAEMRVKIILFSELLCTICMWALFR